MASTAFRTFSYNIGRVRPSPARLWFIYGSIVVVIAMCIFISQAAIALILVLLFAYIITSPTSKLMLGRRYLLCGQNIVYYGNVKRLTLSPAQGLLLLESVNGQSFTLEREKLIVPSRKADKIIRKKAADFEKASTRIIESVRNASSNLELNVIR